MMMIIIKFVAIQELTTSPDVSLPLSVVSVPSVTGPIPITYVLNVPLPYGRLSERLGCIASLIISFTASNYQAIVSR